LTFQCDLLVTSVLHSYKCWAAVKLGVPMVSLAYVDACVSEGRLVDKDAYLVAGYTKAQQLRRGKIQGKSEG
jgi:hypothetical protein